MSPRHRSAADALEERFVAWAKTREDIRGAVVVGSRARIDHPADEWADLDIIIFATRPSRYVRSSRWLRNIGVPVLTFIQPDARGRGMERRVLFDEGMDVDFAIMASGRARQAAPFLRLLGRFPGILGTLPFGIGERIREDIENGAEVFGRGVRVLVDKDGIARHLPRLAEYRRPARAPDRALFEQAAADFWYHVLWTAKKLRRGELWVAKACCDSHLKGLLLQMIEWQARTAKGEDYDTWHEGRFLEEWAAPDILAQLEGTFAHYEEDDIWRALLATMDLFRRLAHGTAKLLGLEYPLGGDAEVSRLVAELETGRRVD